MFCSDAQHTSSSHILRSMLSMSRPAVCNASISCCRTSVWCAPCRCCSQMCIAIFCRDGYELFVAERIGLVPGNYMASSDGIQYVEKHKYECMNSTP